MVKAMGGADYFLLVEKKKPCIIQADYFLINIKLLWRKGKYISMNMYSLTSFQEQSMETIVGMKRNMTKRQGFYILVGILSKKNNFISLRTEQNEMLVLSKDLWQEKNHHRNGSSSGNVAFGFLA